MGRRKRVDSVGVAGGDGDNSEGVERSVLLEVPVELGDVARGEWERIVPMGLRLGLFSSTDRTLLMLYCEQYELVRRLTEECRGIPYILEGASGGAKVHPAHTSLKEAKNSLVQMSKVLGCVPTSRGGVRVGVSEGGVDSVEDEYFG